MLQRHLNCFGGVLVCSGTEQKNPFMELIIVFSSGVLNMSDGHCMRYIGIKQSILEYTTYFAGDPIITYRWLLSGNGFFELSAKTKKIEFHKSWS